MKRLPIRGLAAIMTALSLVLSLLAPGAFAAQPARAIRVHYQAEEGIYDDLGVWYWGDVVTPSEKTGAWPAGRTVFPEANRTAGSAFLDIEVLPEAKQIGMLVIDSKGNKLTGQDVMIDIPSPDMAEVWVNAKLEISYDDLTAIPQGSARIRYQAKEGFNENLGLWFWGDVISPSEKTGAWPVGATPLTADEAKPGASYIDVALKEDAKELGFLFVDRVSGQQTKDYKLDVTSGSRVAYLREGDDTVYANPFGIASAAEETAVPKWKEKDALYATQAPLGAELKADGSAVLRLWAPTADGVNVVLYDKDDQTLVLQDKFAMALTDEHVWELTLDEANTGLASLRGYFYHYLVKRGDSQSLVLDPYARSMAAWDSGNQQGETAGKAAIVDASDTGGARQYADIPGFEDREDAVIYEVHVRDFTSDPAIAGELQAPFGTFAAMAEKLDYIQQLGVTHIQLLPVLSYYYVNELDRSRSPEYASENQNYNWGYDPQSYFALTGMYSREPENPEKRIAEFKELVDAVHARGMGVILDVVYNHTARIELLEDIEPDYYYFTDASGRPKGSFGGGQVGSTHLMARRLISDSLVYLSDTFKVDGFRFDMMGNLDSQTIEEAYARVSALNPDTLWIGEGWRTFSGDPGESVIPADQDWMGNTQAAAVFSDEVRNELKSGFGSEGQPRFVTGGQRSLSLLFGNVQARPNNVSEDDPGDIVQYIEAHDNLTLHDVIALSIKMDPKDHEEEIMARQRLANALLLTHQGIIFLHAGQEYGRTKQFLHPDYAGQSETPPAKSTLMADVAGQAFEYPYFIHDSYDSSDAVNRFDWGKALTSPLHKEAVEYTRGLIALRRSTDAFSYAQAGEIDAQVSRVMSPSIAESDLVIAYTAKSVSSGGSYLVIVNADSQARRVALDGLGLGVKGLEVLVDRQNAGTQALENPAGVALEADAAGNTLAAVTLEPLTATVILSPAK